MATKYSLSWSQKPAYNIVKKEDVPDNPNFWLTFLEIIGVSVLGLAIGTVTGGLGAAAMGYLGYSMFASELTSFVLSSTIQFSINQTYDVLKGNATQLSTFLNIIFSLGNIGKISRGLRSDKILIAAKELNLLTEFGVSQNVANFYQLKNLLQHKSFLTSQKIFFRFGAKISNDQLLVTINQLASRQTVNMIKKMTASQVQALIVIQKHMQKLVPSLAIKITEKEMAEAAKWLKKYNFSMANFLTMSATEANVFYDQLVRTTRISYKNLNRLETIRAASFFTNNWIQNYNNMLKKFGSAISQINPLYWTNKLMSAAIQPIKDAIVKINTKVFSAIADISKKAIEKVTEKGIIPPIDDKMFLYFQLKPTGLEGRVMLRIVKKNRISRKTGRVSHYSDVWINTDIVTAEKFLTSQHQKSFYLKNWAFGWTAGKYKQFTSVFSQFVGTQIVLSGIKTYDLITKLTDKNFFSNQIKDGKNIGNNAKNALINHIASAGSILFTGTNLLTGINKKLINHNKIDKNKEVMNVLKNQTSSRVKFGTNKLVRNQW